MLASGCCQLFGQFPFLAKLFADSAHAGSIFHTALARVLPNLKLIFIPVVPTWSYHDRVRDCRRAPTGSLHVTAPYRHGF
jgi:hypothetical protein